MAKKTNKPPATGGARSKPAVQAPANVTTGPADPAPATTLDRPSGSIMEPAIREGVPMDHPAVDANPRAGTSAEANRIDFNLPAGVQPFDDGVVGEGIDPVPYGKKLAGTKR